MDRVEEHSRQRKIALVRYRAMGELGVRKLQEIWMGYNIMEIGRNQIVKRLISPTKKFGLYPEGGFAKGMIYL